MSSFTWEQINETTIATGLNPAPAIPQLDLTHHGFRNPDANGFQYSIINRDIIREITQTQYLPSNNRTGTLFSDTQYTYLGMTAYDDLIADLYLRVQWIAMSNTQGTFRPPLTGMYIAPALNVDGDILDPFVTRLLLSSIDQALELRVHWKTSVCVSDWILPRITVVVKS